MASPIHHVVAAMALALAATAAAPARAQAPEPAPPYEVAHVRVRYGLALRQGTQIDLGPGLTYSGLTPNDFAGSARYFFGPMVGVGASLHREGFALFTADTAHTRVSSGDLLRASGGPVGRYLLGPFTLEALVGYQMAQFPSFGNSAQPDTTFGAFTRHAAFGAARIGVELPFAGARLEVRGEYPFALVVTAPSSTEAISSSGMAGGASIILPVASAGTVQCALVADYQYIQDTVLIGTASAPTFTATQTLQRGGVAVELSFLDHPPPPRFGTVLVRAVDADSGQPLAAAAVALNVGGRDVQVRSGTPGAFSAQDLPPGPALAKVTAGGYLPAEGKGTVVAGQEAVIDVKVKKEPPKVGSLLITLLDKEDKHPIAGATVKVRGVEKQTSDQGTVTFDNLNPGPAAVEATVPDYRPVSEVASVVAFKTAEMPLSLVKTKATVLATITGLVRTSNGGKPMAALLEIPEAKVKTRAVASTGAFTFRIRGGTYSLIISAPGFITQQKTVTVKDGDQAIYNVDLHPTR